MTDHDVHAALRSRAERGSPRASGALFDAALTDSRTLRTGLDGDRPGPRGGGRTRTWYAAAAAVFITVCIGAAIRAASDGDDPVERLSTDASTFCRTMAEPVIGDQPDAVVYLEPEVSPADVQRVEATLSVLPGLIDLHHVDADETWAAFRELFRDEPAMLENVRPTDLPTSFELDFEAFDGAVETALRNALEPVDDALDHPEIRTASDMRTLDVVAFVGYVATAHGAADPDLSIGGMIGGRLSDLVAGDPTLEPQVRTDLVLMQQVVAGGLDRRLSATQVDDIAAAADRLTERAVTSCGLPFDETFGLPDATTDSGMTTETDPVAPSPPPSGD